MTQTPQATRQGAQETEVTQVTPEQLRAHLEAKRDEIEALIVELVSAESPSDRPEVQGAVRDILKREWQANGYRVRQWRGGRWGGGLLVRPTMRRRDRPIQLLVGHFDTVWPLGTLERMPVCRDGDHLHGPGVFDMKAGLAMMIFAVRALQELGGELPADVVAFINADEEVGSPESRSRLTPLARTASRAWVLEPSYGSRGALKTARKGVADFELHITGRASHAGLAPDEGASAVAELAHIIQKLHGLADPARGISVNVGVVQGGTRANVVAAAARAVVDVRVLTQRDGHEVETAIRSIAAAPETPGVSVQVTGGFQHQPFEASPRNQKLWEVAQAAGAELGLDLAQVTVGGASDGNLTSLHTPTLDGLGAVGDGAHADHEHICVSQLPGRTALLAMLLQHPLE